MGSCDGNRVGGVAQWSQTQRDDTSKFIEAQLDGYEKAGGWIFWTWKTETAAPGWDMTDLLANHVFPSPVTSRKCKSRRLEPASTRPTNHSCSPWPVWLRWYSGFRSNALMTV